MAAWCRQSAMEVISSAEALVGAEGVRQGIRVQQLNEEGDNEASGTSEVSDDEWTTSEEELSCIMQILVGPGCVEEQFETEESATKEVEFLAADGEKKKARVRPWQQGGRETGQTVREV